MIWLVALRTDIPSKIYIRLEAQEISAASVEAESAGEALLIAIERWGIDKKYSKHFTVQKMTDDAELPIGKIDLRFDASVFKTLHAPPMYASSIVSSEGLYNFRLRQYDHVDLDKVTDFSDYMPQVGFPGIYHIYVEHDGMVPFEAYRKVMDEVIAGIEGSA